MLKTFFSQLSVFASGGAGLFVLVLCCALFFFLGAVFARLALLASLSKIIAEERSDAVKKSRAVLGGLAGEQVAPFMPGFPCNPADARFVGKPVDFVAFSGAADGDEIKEILLIEVKSGEASLSKRERQIKACVESGLVRFVEYRIN
ncbi:MAG: Holliday junction resolvase [Treponema sp.]|nr:Holliday junction resolvase [Treponema sp.]